MEQIDIAGEAVHPASSEFLVKVEIVAVSPILLAIPVNYYD
ncbi:hypothetical protein [Neobacillus notoginsengisoli]|nr:hypothetical protein [Neobacillus notoginsengisoli]